MNKNKLTINPSNSYARVTSPRLAVNTSSLKVRLTQVELKKLTALTA